jgi:murein DD-endopeptidase MepM/ murein hydrolase activator NlpD
MTVRLVLTTVLLVLLGRPAAAYDEPAGVWPLEPRPEVVAGFDPPSDPWGSGHRGADLAGRVGQPVRAALAGTVAWAGPIAGKGVVTISHGDTRTTYEPVAASVSVGDRVLAGDRIGVLAVPFSHCFPAACLHWGLLRGETYLDPLSLVGGGRVRLLPLWRAEPADGWGSAATSSAASPGAIGWSAPRLPYAAWSPADSATLP